VALRDELRAQLEALTAATAMVLASADDVNVDDPEIAARLVVATIEALVHRFVAQSEPQDVEVLQAELVVMLSRYLRGDG
jgi:hypothetical protein